MAKSRRKNDTGIVADSGLMTETAPPRSSDTTPVNIDRERVARRAYEIYLARGGADGLAMEDWLAAERELQQRGSES